VDEELQNEIYLLIVQVLASLQEFEQACQVVHQIKPWGADRSKALRYLIQALVQTGSIDHALRIATGKEHRITQAELLNSVAQIKPSAANAEVVTQHIKKHVFTHIEGSVGKESYKYEVLETIVNTIKKHEESTYIMNSPALIEHLAEEISSARVAGREALFHVSGENADSLAALDKGQTLRKILAAIVEAEEFWNPKEDSQKNKNSSGLIQLESIFFELFRR
jgi:hypothetical protein